MGAAAFGGGSPLGARKSLFSDSPLVSGSGAAPLTVERLQQQVGVKHAAFLASNPDAMELWNDVLGAVTEAGREQQHSGAAGGAGAEEEENDAAFGSPTLTQANSSISLGGAARISSYGSTGGAQAGTSAASGGAEVDGDKAEEGHGPAGEEEHSPGAASPEAIPAAALASPRLARLKAEAAGASAPNSPFATRELSEDRQDGEFNWLGTEGAAFEIGQRLRLGCTFRLKSSVALCLSGS